MSEMTSRPEPYVGVSGVVNVEQQRQLEIMELESHLAEHRRRLLLGVKAVHKTQFLDKPNKYGAEWYPVGYDQFASALSQRGLGNSTLNIAQAYLDPEYIENPGYREFFVKRIFERGTTWIDGIQFDMLPWHTDTAMLDFLAQLKSKYDATVLLQCHKDAMNALGPDGVVDRLEEYAPAIDYVLFDSSHGTGTRLNTRRLKPFLAEAYENAKLDAVGFAIAGGLNGTVVREDLPSLVDQFPDISWDAEGQLHPANNDGVMPLDMDRTGDYLNASAEVLDD